MGRDWFVKPETTKIELDDKEWICVKNELNYGEKANLIKESKVKIGAEGAEDFSPMDTAIPGILAYVVGWSVETDGKSHPIARETLEAMPFDYVLEIGAAINGHILNSAEEKKVNSPNDTSSESEQS